MYNFKKKIDILIDGNNVSQKSWYRAMFATV